MIRVVTRDSPLSVAQTEQLLSDITDQTQQEFEMITTKAKGDIDMQDRFDKIGGKGLFTKELDEYLLQDKADIAVHSLKDVPSSLPDQIQLCGIGLGLDVRDAWVSTQYKSIGDLPKGSKVGTSSVRRQAQLRRYYPDLTVVPMRGNLQTRFAKMKKQGLEGMILASSGLMRMGMKDFIREHLPIDEFVPAIGQGYLGLTKKEGTSLDFLTKWQDDQVWQQMTALRVLMHDLQGGCSVPLGASWTQDQSLIVFLSSIGGDTVLYQKLSMLNNHLETVHAMLANLRDAGADEIIKEYHHGS